MLKAALMIILFYLINFVSWDLMVDYQMVSPEWASLIVYTVLFVVSLGLYGRHLWDERDRFKKKIDTWWKFFLELLILSFLGAALTLLAFHLTSHSGQPTNQENLSNMVDSLPVIFSLVMVTILGPVIEELTFRQSIVGVMSRSKTLWTVVSIIISVVAFDMIHVVELHEFWHYLPMSVLLVFFYIRYERNVWASIAFHIFYNLSGYLLLALGVLFA
ncbi:lysostaphin resistance A-like protein [Amphibacillus sp. Q70]|uniref:CPBP family intramembrane glutamic endopeptidase n=1 Tax=Amphibacillus sp. Q70 TaxID=3453416 RepID=UPI003F858733